MLKITVRGSVLVTHEIHNLVYVGSIPTPASYAP